uniref:Uncharacterized protein n=1 Tax=Phlebotomus papatasi TaxID=29031 RepID=A0A1B0DGW6_PHLPP
MHKSFVFIQFELIRMSMRFLLNTCASSVGGPGRYFGEQSGPESGSVAFGTANSAFIPHTTVVSPYFTTADPSAVPMEFTFTDIGRYSKNFLAYSNRPFLKKAENSTRLCLVTPQPPAPS